MKADTGMRVMMWSAAIISFILFAFCCCLYLSFRSALSAELDRDLTTQVEECKDAFGLRSGACWKSENQKHKCAGGIERSIEVFDAKGISLLSLPNQTMRTPIRMRYKSSKCGVDGELVTVRLGLSERRLQDSLSYLLNFMAIALPTTVGLTSLIAYWVARRVRSYMRLNQPSGVLLRETANTSS